jgi:hypothetical protein
MCITLLCNLGGESPSSGADAKFFDKLKRVSKQKKKL